MAARSFRIFIISLFLLTAGFFAAWRYRPAIVVNGTVIYAREVNTNERLASSYYSHAAGLYRSLQGVSSSTEVMNIDESKIKELVSTELIERALIHKELFEKLGPEILEAMVAARIERALNARVAYEAAEKIYGSSEEEAATHIFVPEAEKDIISSRIFLEGGMFDEWIAKKKRESSVKVFMSGYVWNGEKVVAE